MSWWRWLRWRVAWELTWFLSRPKGGPLSFAEWKEWCCLFGGEPVDYEEWYQAWRRMGPQEQRDWVLAEMLKNRGP